MTTWWGTVRNELKLGDHLGRPLTTEIPEPPRGPRRDLAFLRERNEMSRLSCRRVAEEVYGFIRSAPFGMMPADPRPQHDGWPRGVIGGWTL